MVKLSLIREIATNKLRSEKLHNEISLKLSSIISVLDCLCLFYREKIGWSNSVKALTYLLKTFSDLRTQLRKLSTIEGLYIPDLTRLHQFNQSKVEKIINQDQLLKVFKSFSYEKTPHINIKQHRVIEKIHLQLSQFLHQLGILFLYEKYSRKVNESLFKVIDRVDNWYNRSKILFIKSNKKCNKVRKALFQILLANKYDRGSIFYAVPKDMIMHIFSYVW